MTNPMAKFHICINFVNGAGEALFFQYHIESDLMHSQLMLEYVNFLTNANSSDDFLWVDKLCIRPKSISHVVITKVKEMDDKKD